MGRLVERADKTSRLLDVKYYILLPSLTDVGTPLDDIQWAAVLRSASALEMYRKRHGHIAPEQIVEFLVLDREFPRSIHHCLTAANDSLHSISGTPVGMHRNPAEQRLGQLRAELAYADTEHIIKRGLHEFLDGFQAKLNLADQCIYDTFLRSVPSAPARPIEPKLNSRSVDYARTLPASGPFSDRDIKVLHVYEKVIRTAPSTN